MESDPKISFDDTAIAFSYKSDRELKKAHFIFSLVNNPWVSSAATRLAKLSLNLHLPVKGLIRATVFEHFCGGETIDQSEHTIQTLHKFKIGTILDYSVEGEESEAAFDETASKILSTIDKAKNNPAIPFSVFKVTGIASFDLLEKVHANENLSDTEQIAWEHVQQRVERICQHGFENNVPVLIDAEDSWIQNPIDTLAYNMMKKFNQQKPIVFNTYQMYRADMFDNLKQAYENASKGNYFLGAKLVRGAYMEKEAARAEKLAYRNPIHPSKEATDKCYDDGLEFCLEHIDRISFMCGSHNENSNKYLASLIHKKGLKHNDPHIWFAQLLGMSDNISFNLANAGYNVAKYVPFGPLESVMPYLLRRAAENTSVAGQSSRELLMIRKELKRRKNGK